MTTKSHRKPTIAAPLILEFSLIFLSCNKNKKSWRSNGGKIRKISTSQNTPSHRRTRHRHRFTHPPPVTHRRCLPTAALIRWDSQRSVRRQSLHCQATTSSSSNSIATNTNTRRLPIRSLARKGTHRAGTHPDPLSIHAQTKLHLQHISRSQLLLMNNAFFFYCVC